MNGRKKKTHLVWIDLEMTGLNAQVDVILEIATIITDNQLNVIAEGPAYVIHQSESALALMDDWVRNLHNKTGLTRAVQESDISLQKAYEDTLAFIKTYCPIHAANLAGNSVWNDKIFLAKYMPDIVKYLHYRIVDVSSVKEIVQRWYPESPFIEFKKEDNHRALNDIRASVAELAHYRKHFFVKPEDLS